MNFDWTSMAVAGSLTVVFAMASDAARSVLRAIFRRPRRTSVIVEMHGKRVEVSGSSPEEVQAALDELLNARLESTEPSRGQNEGQEDDSESQVIGNHGIVVTGPRSIAISGMSTGAGVTGESHPPGTNGTQPTERGGANE
ncbi:hypothetical protein [Streptomyces africanus]|uniref:hypothetical protein n=1 Tax=Streptomyces africanus TaxID=231024 RepID=UPI00117FE192|nr:hypothetical protein [Streptomyces africanus]